MSGPDHAARRTRAAAALEDAGADAVVVTARANVRYLTGFRGSNGQLLLTTAGDALLVTDARYEERAASEAPGLTTVLDRDWPRQAAGFARDHGARRVAFESRHLSHHDAHGLLDLLAEEGLEGVATEELIELLRVVKDEHEVAVLRRACSITVEALEAALALAAPGRTERELAVMIERTMVDLGADGTAFDSIVASGPNSAVPHHAPTERVLARGDLLKLDVGARVDGYHADMTRTVALGDPGPDLRTVHDLVREAQARGVAAAVDGASTGDVDAACRSYLDDAGHGDHFVHGTGHGVGLDIHEAPTVAPGASATLRPGTAITVEPGVYLPGRGGVRIEDTVVIRPSGPPEPLTDAPRELRLL